MTGRDETDDLMLDAQLRAAAERLPGPTPMGGSVRDRIEKRKSQRSKSQKCVSDRRRATWIALAAVVLVSLGVAVWTGRGNETETPEQDQVAEQRENPVENSHRRGPQNLAALTRQTLRRIDRPLAQLEAPLQKEADSLTRVLRRSKERFVQALPGLVSDRLR